MLLGTVNNNILMDVFNFSHFIKLPVNFYLFHFKQQSRSFSLVDLLDFTRRTAVLVSYPVTIPFLFHLKNVLIVLLYNINVREVLTVMVTYINITLFVLLLQPNNRGLTSIRIIAHFSTINASRFKCRVVSHEMCFFSKR